MKDIETLSKTHTKAAAGLAKDLGETSDDLRKKAREGDALRAKAGKFEASLATLHDAPKSSEER